MRSGFKPKVKRSRPAKQHFLLLLEAVNQRDYPIITGVFLIVGVAVMVINLLVDLSYGLLDPKVRYR